MSKQKICMTMAGSIRTPSTFGISFFVGIYKFLFHVILQGDSTYFNEYVIRFMFVSWFFIERSFEKSF